MLELNKELEETYVILDEIGSGGGGTVFKAYHKRLQKEVVLKKIHSNLARSSSVNIRAEADILKNLKHEYLPQVLDFFELDGDVYTVMDFIPGASLKSFLKEGRRFSQQQAVRWFDQLCQAVEQLHRQQPPIIHGDIKPDNIMLTPDDNICLIDFNVSGDFTDADAAGYTPGYAAPEQMSSFQARKKRMAIDNANKAVIESARRADSDYTQADSYTGADSDYTQADGYAPAYYEAAVSAEQYSSQADTGASGTIHMDTRSDIYSIGATMYHLLTGEKPAIGYVKPITSFPIKIEESLAFIIMKCLEQDPAKRYQSIQELHKAVLGVHTSSRIYRRLVRRQLITRIVLLIGIAGFSVLASFGFKRMEIENQNKYAQYVQQEKSARENKNYDETEEWYQKAIALYPEKGEAYIEKAYSLYDQKKYEDAILFVNNVVLNAGCEGEDLANIYFIYGNCCFEIENYEAAEQAFRNAITYRADNSQVYRDYAITLARLDRTDEAKIQLEEAIEKGLAEDGIYYIQGEISLALANADEAWDEFQQCINSSKDDYMKMRAYIMCSRILDEKGKSADVLQQNVELLSQALQELPNEYKNAILDKLAQAYTELANATQDSSYDMKAAAVFDEIINYGWATYTTYHNKAVLYQKNRMYSEENDVLQKMLTLYGENYNTYKRLAFMEASRQLETPNEDRDYSLFADYYRKSVQLYEKQLSDNKTDLEMTTLADLYQQAVSGGWIT